MTKTPITIYVTKEDGSQELFIPEKLETSLVKAGANPTTAEKIVRDVLEKINKESLVQQTTTDIYKEAFKLLKDLSSASAARYSLRRSLMEFGPTGFPFEEYIAEIFKTQGYSTLTDQVVFGSCVPHEVDVVAWKKDKLIMTEVKYHNEPAGKTDLKVALYVKARYDDLRLNKYEYGMPQGESRNLDEGWLITNTKFTDTAITYATCSNVKLLSWDYPEEGNLRQLIEGAKLHPITCLTSITAAEKAELMKHKIVLCKTIFENHSALKALGFTELKIAKLMEEISDIMRYN